MKEINIADQIQKRDRGYTVKEALENASKHGYDAIVIAGLSSDGGIDLHFSENNSLEAVGLLEVAKQAKLNEMV